VSEKSLADEAKRIKDFLESLTYVQIGLQFFLKNLIDGLMVAFYCL
jgi:hypothetical protein